MGSPEGPGDLQAALPREMYVDPGAFAVERDRVLYGEWFCVGRRADLGLHEPGRVAVVDVVGESVLLTSDESGRLHAAYNVCRHRGSQVVPTAPGAEPVCAVAGALRCPYHSWTYELDGRLLRAPHADLTEADAAAFGLHPIESGAGQARLRPPRHPRRRPRPRRWPGRPAPRSYPMAELATGLRFGYEVDANYKVMAENYNECYHCGPVHPELTRLVPPSGAVAPASTGTTECPTARVPGPSPCRARPPGRRCRASTRRSGPGTRANWCTPT